MTMQIAIQAQNGFALASDTLHRVDHGTGVASVEYHPKIIENRRHKALIAMQGQTANRLADPASEFSEYLDGQASIEKGIVEAWGREYINRTGGDHFGFLIVQPTKRSEPLLKFGILGDEVLFQPRDWVLVAGIENSPATVWHQYFRCNGQQTLSEAVHIAAFTILMAGEMHTDGVGGLEVWRYQSKWKALSKMESDAIKERYNKLTRYMRRTVSAQRKSF